jgi:hypothetical protein
VAAAAPGRPGSFRAETLTKPKTLMKNKTCYSVVVPVLLALMALDARFGTARAQGTGFTYNGRLNANGGPANGNYDLTFTLFTASSGGTPAAGPLTNAATVLSNGLFTVTLDFGTGVFDGTGYWLGIGVRTNGSGGFTTLSPRQQVTPVPYAIFAGTASNVVPGLVVQSLNGLKGNLTLAAGTNVTITPSGNTLTIASPGAGGSGLWSGNGTNAYYNTGNVGIGTNRPISKLDVFGAQDALGLSGFQPFLTFKDTNSSNARSRIQSVGGTLDLLTESYMNGSNAFAYLTLNNSGNVGIGSPTPVSKLEVVAQDALSLIGYQPFLTLKDSNAGYARSRIQGAGGDIIFETEGYVAGSSPNGYAQLTSSGNLSVGSLTIRGGADLAEPFELSAQSVAKGSVVVIDDEHPGRLKLSDRAYDTRVAGIISGANGINPGIAMHQEGALEGGQNVALTGRVYVLADDSNGPIRPGDLLTTSATPGNAMKVTDHSRSPGAILGKAMGSLKEGKGMVLVLVTLQ